MQNVASSWTHFLNCTSEQNLSKLSFRLFHHWLHNNLTLRLSSCRWKSAPKYPHISVYLISNNVFSVDPQFCQPPKSVTAGAGSESPLSLSGCCLWQLPAVKRLFVGVISKSMHVVRSVMCVWVCVRWLPRPMSQDQTVNKAVSRKQSRFCCVTLPPSLPSLSLSRAAFYPLFPVLLSIISLPSLLSRLMFLRHPSLFIFPSGAAGLCNMCRYCCIFISRVLFFISPLNHARPRLIRCFDVRRCLRAIKPGF